MNRPVAVFDLDGTLADTNRDLVPVLNRATATAGLPPVPIGDVGFVVGQGAKAMIRHAFAWHGKPLDDELLERLFTLFLDDYERNLCVETVLFDGVREALDRLAGDGWLLAVCTNKMEKFAIPLLEQLGIAGHFSAVTGGDTFDVRKPDARHLSGTIERAGGRLERSVMIGDSKTDIEAARNAGVPSIVIPFGYSDRPVAEYGPDRIIASFDDLTPALARSMLREAAA